MEVIEAAMDGDAVRVQASLDDPDADVNAALNHWYPDQRTALHQACENGHANVVEILLRSGAD